MVARKLLPRHLQTFQPAAATGGYKGRGSSLVHQFHCSWRPAGGDADVCGEPKQGLRCWNMQAGGALSKEEDEGLKLAQPLSPAQQRLPLSSYLDITSPWLPCPADHQHPASAPVPSSLSPAGKRQEGDRSCEFVQPEGEKRRPNTTVRSWRQDRAVYFAGSALDEEKTLKHYYILNDLRLSSSSL